MKAGLRFCIAALAAALALAPLAALAQESSPPSTNTPAADTIGPRELENFTLNGTVTRPAPTAPAATTAPPRPAAPSPSPGAASESRPAPARDRPASRTAPETSAPAPAATASVPSADPFMDYPTPAPTADLGAQPGFEPAPSAAAGAADDQPTDFVPWLLALILIGAGIGYYFWRQQSQPSYATAGGVTDARAAAEPAAAPEPLRRAPAPAAAPSPAAPPQSAGGIVSTRLRPWLEIEFSPGRCVVEDDKATIQFDIALFNSGNAPARDVLIEASMFNAGPAQDQEIGAFFAHPVAKGERIPAIPPLKRVALKSAVSLTREQMRQFEVAGRRLFVPLVGFNALYRWSGGDGQTSASYLVGRDTDGEKMAPLRLDLGPRIFRGLGARQHDVAVRR